MYIPRWLETAGKEEEMGTRSETYLHLPYFIQLARASDTSSKWSMSSVEMSGRAAGQVPGQRNMAALDRCYLTV